MSQNSKDDIAKMSHSDFTSILNDNLNISDQYTDPMSINYKFKDEELDNAILECSNNILNVKDFNTFINDIKEYISVVGGGNDFDIDRIKRSIICHKNVLPTKQSLIAKFPFEMEELQSKWLKSTKIKGSIAKKPLYDKPVITENNSTVQSSSDSEFDQEILINRSDDTKVISEKDNVVYQNKLHSKTYTSNNLKNTQQPLQSSFSIDTLLNNPRLTIFPIDPKIVKDEPILIKLVLSIQLEIVNSIIKNYNIKCLPIMVEKTIANYEIWKKCASILSKDLKFQCVFIKDKDPANGLDVEYMKITWN